MIDFSQLLLDKIDIIIENWVEAVRQDNKIKSADHLPFKAIRDSLPDVLEAMATMLSPSQESDVQTLVEKSLEHGALRAEQGYDAAEIAREYRLVRSVIVSTLEADLLQASAAEVLRAVRMIDTVVDEAIAQCFKSYTEERLGELKQLQTNLTLNNQELTRLVRTNQENISHLAHELKNPLTSIIGYSDLFLRLQRQNAEVKDTFANLEHIERVLRKGREILRLINDALEISRYEAGQMKLQPTQTEIRSLIRDVMETMEPLARLKQLEMKVDCERAPQQVVSDSLRLQQIVTNLVSNAIRYTESGSIQVSCQQLDHDKWAIAVSDTGIGIAPEDQIRIFEPYFRVEFSDRPYQPDSTGLGLAIVSRLVNLLQGKIELVSQGGVGSTFTVIFPLEVQ
ncbi:MAG: sensor histidine kinase [Coleofasciculus sp. S288]|nr:sensor histidine kinase [Coleofasciculus sp. S288]